MSHVPHQNEFIFCHRSSRSISVLVQLPGGDEHLEKNPFRNPFISPLLIELID
jgi:hypothetical protein